MSTTNSLTERNSRKGLLALSSGLMLLFIVTATPVYVYYFVPITYPEVKLVSSCKRPFILFSAPAIGQREPIGMAVDLPGKIDPGHFDSTSKTVGV